MRKRICVIDGQGGGIGVSLIKHIRDSYRESVGITAMGTNAIAASQMMKAGANQGASGEVTSASASKLLLPVSQERVIIAGFHKEPLPHLIKFLVEELREVLSHV